MKLMIFLVGLVLSVWVGFTVYSPVNEFVIGVKKVYIQSQTIQRTVTDKSGVVINTITDAYQEMARMFGIEVAEDTAKEEVINTSDQKDVLERLFDHNIALWVSVICGALTMSLYFNIIWFIAFFFKPITFLMKK